LQEKTQRGRDLGRMSRRAVARLLHVAPLLLHSAPGPNILKSTSQRLPRLFTFDTFPGTTCTRFSHRLAHNMPSFVVFLGFAFQLRGASRKYSANGDSSHWFNMPCTLRLRSIYLSIYLSIFLILNMSQNSSSVFGSRGLVSTREQHAPMTIRQSPGVAKVLRGGSCLSPHLGTTQASQHTDPARGFALVRVETFQFHR